MRILTFVFCLVMLHAQAQESLPIGDAGLITFEEVVEVPKMPKGLLFENAKTWFGTYYKSPRVIQSKDAMEGTINAKSMFKIMSELEGDKAGGVINYTLDLKIKEGKYRYTITNLRHTDKTGNIGSGGKLERDEPLCGYKEMKVEQWEGIKTQSQTGVDKLIEALKKAMEYTSPDESDDF